MTQLKPRNEAEVTLSSYVNRSDLIIEDQGCVSAVWPTSDNLLSNIKHALQKLNQSDPRAVVYEKQDIPDRWHYKNNVRVAPMIVVAKEGHQIQTVRKMLIAMDAINKTMSFQNATSRRRREGDHGYDNDLMAMRPVFFASGPSFKASYEFEQPFELVNIYPLACHLLNITPSPNNGSLNNVKHLLASSAHPRDYHTALFTALFAMVIRLIAA